MAPALAKELDAVCQSNTPTWRVQHNTALPRTKDRSPDSNWIGKLRTIDSDCLWLIISHDHGKNDKRENERLPMVCKAHGHPYVVVSKSLKTTREQKTAILEVLKHFPDDVVKACATLRHRKAPHVKLARVTMKGGAIGYHLRVGEHPILRFIAPPPAAPERGDDFALCAD